MSVNNLTLGEIKELLSLFGCTNSTLPIIPTCSDFGKEGRKVIVRSRDTGVIYGEFVSLDGLNVTVKNARQLWKWKTKKGISLVDVAQYGVTKSGCNFSTGTAEMMVLNACAIIYVTEDAAKSIEEV